MGLSYVIGDATRPIGSGYNIIAHVVNDIGAWGAGFSGAVSRRWPAVEDVYRSLANAGKLTLGAVHFIDMELGTVTVANMVAQHGVGRQVPPPIRYAALAKCLDAVAVAARAHGGSVHMPRIGCGLAGGTWDRVEPIIQQSLRDVDVYIYDLEGS